MSPRSSTWARAEFMAATTKFCRRGSGLQPRPRWSALPCAY
jgi:hypothetical protein